jgi:hypothetical protein
MGCLFDVPSGDLDMNKIVVGRTIIALSAALGAIGSTIIDNIAGPNAHMRAVQTWPPHALFHDAAMFLLLDGVTLICLWLLFRRSREPEIAARVTTLLVMAYWTPFFYITTVYPQASLAPTSPVGHPFNIHNFESWDLASQTVTPVIFGIPVHVNAIVGAMWVVIALVGYTIFRRGMREGSIDPRLAS